MNSGLPDYKAGAGSAKASDGLPLREVAKMENTGAYTTLRSFGGRPQGVEWAVEV